MTFLFSSALLASLFFFQVFAQESIVLTARCPALCDLPVADAFRECAPFSTIGCTLSPCGTGFGCSFPAPVDTEVTVTPGEEIVLEGLHVLDRFKFQVNLNSSFALQTDFYLLSDATGSMGTAISEVKTRFIEIVNLYENLTDAHFGIGLFRDEAERDSALEFGFMNAQSLTGNRADVFTAIDSLVARGGGDADEANLVALNKVATNADIGWRPNSRKILVYFGDNPGHEPTCIGGGPITRDTVIENLKAKNITVVAVSFGTGLDRSPRPFECASGNAGTGQGTAIATATGGVLLPNTQQAKVIEAIENAVLNLNRTYDLDSSDCDGKLITSTNPALPITLAPRDSQVVDQIIVIESGVCTGGATFECTLKYTEAGASLAPTRLKFLDIQGCPEF